MTIRLVADRRSRRVIGAQLLGKGVVDKRLDSIVSAVSSGMTVDMLADADFAYAPPFATALDPTTHAANALRNKLDGLVKTYSPKELKDRMEETDPPFLLDVRSPQELDLQGRLPYDSVNIPLGQLRGRLAEIPMDREIIAFCKISVRGWDALATLRGNGFENVALLEGGVMAWPYDLR